MLFKNKNVLITGGAGFIGSNLAIRLVKEGASVTVVDSFIPNYGGNIFNLNPVKEKINLNISDTRDLSSLLILVQNKDFIFNLAGQISHQDSMNDPFTDVEINVKAQLNLLEACRRYNPDAVVVYTSTRQLYGRPRYLPVDESHPLNPADVNGINKLAGEQYHTLYSEVYGLKTVSLRLTNTYGPRQLIKNSRQGFVGWFINRVITENKIQLFGSGEQVRDFNIVDDVIAALLAAATNSKCYGKVYNLSGERASLKFLAEKIVSVNGYGEIEVIPFPEERKKIDIGDYYGISESFTNDTGWQAITTLDQGLVHTLDYFKKYKEYYLGET